MKLSILTLVIYFIITLKVYAQSGIIFKNDLRNWENIHIYMEGFSPGVEYMKVDTLVQSWQQVFSDEQGLRARNHKHLKMRSVNRHTDIIVITSEIYNLQKKHMVIHADLYRDLYKEFRPDNWRFWMLF